MVVLRLLRGAAATGNELWDKAWKYVPRRLVARPKYGAISYDTPRAGTRVMANRIPNKIGTTRKLTHDF